MRKLINAVSERCVRQFDLYCRQLVQRGGRLVDRICDRIQRTRPHRPPADQKLLYPKLEINHCLCAIAIAGFLSTTT
jgi:hypothetical protein